MDDLERMKAEFAARGGTVEKIPAGQGLHLSRRAWREKVGWEPEVVRRERVETEERGITVVTDHLGREFYKNAEGEWI